MAEYKYYTATELGLNGEAYEKRSLKFYDIREVSAFRIYGLYDYKSGESFRRLPEDVAASTSPAVKDLALHTAGGRVRFVTDSTAIAVRVFFKKLNLAPNLSPIGANGFDIYIRKGGKERFESTLSPIAGMKRPPYDMPDGYADVTALPAGMKEITLNLPYFQPIDKLYIGLDSASVILPHSDYRFEKPILYYGSSITQGLCASRPGMIYEAIISRKLDANFINLGFGGACLGEKAISDYIATVDPSVFVYDYDHNSTVIGQYKNTHESLYLNFRSKHPDTPVIFVGRPDFWLDGYLNDRVGIENRKVLRKTYENALARGEKVYFIDGYNLFTYEGREDCTADSIHPNDLGMHRMAEAIGAIVEIALNGN